MVIGRWRSREHPMYTSKGGSRDLRSLRVLRNFRLRTLKGTPKGSSDLWSHPVAMLLLLRKKRGKKRGMRRTYFRPVPLPVTWLWHFRSKCPTRADMVQLPVAHAHNILPDMVTSGHVTSGCSTANVAWAVPIYYFDRSVTLCIETIVWRYNGAICVGVQYGYTKGFNWMRYSVKININRSIIGRSLRNLKILMFQNSYFHFLFRLEFIIHLKETLSWLCVSGMWSSKGMTTEAQLKTKV